MTEEFIEEITEILAKLSVEEIKEFICLYFGQI